MVLPPTGSPKLARVDRGMRGDIVDRLLWVQRRALPAHIRQRIDQHAGQLQHPEFEDREQAHWAGADDRYVRADVACHAPVVLAERTIVRDSTARADCRQDFVRARLAARGER